MLKIRAYRFVLSLPFVAALVSILFLNPRNYAHFLIFGIFFILGLIFLFFVRCPRCGKSPFLRTTGSGVNIGFPWPESLCSSCGFDFRHYKLEEHEERLES